MPSNFFRIKVYINFYIHVYVKIPIALSFSPFECHVPSFFGFLFTFLFLFHDLIRENLQKIQICYWHFKKLQTLWGYLCPVKPCLATFGYWCLCDVKIGNLSVLVNSIQQNGRCHFCVGILLSLREPKSHWYVIYRCLIWSNTSCLYNVKWLQQNHIKLI